MSKRMEFYGPAILDALVSAGGGQHLTSVYQHVLSRLTGRLSPEDFELTDSGSGEPKWQHRTRFAKQDMVKAGLIHPPRQNGFWEITVAGRKWHAERRHRV